ncbi:hypothetical protein KA082_01710 [Candidatus Woesebacteria bacterium]|nr:hypothetical protein [Candidatus Woesebacteria bacterium]
MLRKENGIIYKEGAYGVLLTPGHEAVMLLGLPSEDAAKSERLPQVSSRSEWVQLQPGEMYSGFGGATEEAVDGVIEPEKKYTDTLMREGWEEFWLPLQPWQITNGLPLLQIQQLRGQKQVDFSAHGHSVVLHAQQQEFLAQNFPHIIVQLFALADFLHTEGQQIVRPFMWVALQKSLKEGLLTR